MRTIPRQYKTRKRKELDAAIAAVEKLQKGIGTMQIDSAINDIEWAEHILRSAKVQIIEAWGPK